MSVDELLWVINHHEVDNNLKKSFMRYFLWVYMKTAGSAVESGAGDLPHDALEIFLLHIFDILIIIGLLSLHIFEVFFTCVALDS